MKIDAAHDKQAREQGLREFLEWTAKVMPVGLLALIHERGRSFTSAALPADVERGEAKQCFRNAFQLAMSRDDLIYVEGYASSIIPVLHAWCVTTRGVVVDPTWKDAEECAYYGIPLRRDFAQRLTFRNQFYGLLADPKTAHVIHRTDPRKYLRRMR